MHEKRYRHPDGHQTSPRRRSFEKTAETISMAVGAVGLGLEKRDGTSKIYVKNIEKRSNSQNDGCNWKKNIGKTGCYHFVIRYFHTKISGLQSTSADFLKPWALYEAATMMMCQICQVSRIFPHPKKNAATVHPSVGFCPPNLWVPVVGVLWSKKNLQIFMDGIGLKKLLSESSKGEDVFAPRSSGFCSGFLPWKKNLGKKKNWIIMAWSWWLGPASAWPSFQHFRFKKTHGGRVIGHLVFSFISNDEWIPYWCVMSLII